MAISLTCHMMTHLSSGACTALGVELRPQHPWPPYTCMLCSLLQGAPAPSSAAAGVANAAAAVSAVASALASAAGPSPGPIPTAGVVTGTAAGSSTPGPGSGSSTPAGAGAGGSGSSGKKLLPTSKATSGPSSAALKRGPGRPPKSNKVRRTGGGWGGM